MAYAPPWEAWDEMVAPDGSVRPHWQAVAQAVSALSAEQMARRWEVGQNLLRDNGVTYNVYGDPQGLDRPWRLDPIPLVLSAAEWAEIERGVAQRATVLDAVLGDLYGPRRLIASRVVPPVFLHANPGFLRPCHGWLPAGRSRLRLYAADLARGADGRWRVVADRADGPAGAGYALENRTVVGRVLPDLLRSLPLRRLGPFFDALRRAAQAASPRRGDEPCMVLLTPGPYTEAYFEHAFLSRHLAIPMVQAEDLTVRDNNVYVKTLSGLQQVDVILRRTGGEWCDPLELRGDSTLGVAGLVQSARAGNVAVVNALGTGLLDGAAVMGLLPMAARRLLGEDLLLGSVRQWWGGQPEECAHVLADFDAFSLRPAFHNRTGPVAAAGLDLAGRERLKQAVQARPWEWVAQVPEDFSSVPVWVDGALQPRRMLLRVFAVASDRGWQVMPGGLARVAAQQDLAAARLQAGGGGSKDVWVLSEPRPDAPAVVHAPQPALRLVRAGRDVPSRVADNMFWLGRYLERCEATTRLLRAGLDRVEEALDQNDSMRAGELACTLTGMGLSCPSDVFGGDRASLAERLMGHHLDPSGFGLANCVERMMCTVMHLRDRLSADTWRALQRLRDDVGRMRGGDGGLNDVVLTISAVSGLAMENMARGPLWVFLDAGRRMERAVAVVNSLLGALSGAMHEAAVPLDLLLDVWDSAMTYRSRYMAAPALSGVLDMLLCDEGNPRSAGFQFAALARHMDVLASGGEGDLLRPEQKLTTVLCAAVRTADVAALAPREGGYGAACALLSSVRADLWKLSDVVAREYFAHARWHLPASPLAAQPVEPLP